jgi:hypothetical protein
VNLRSITYTSLARLDLDAADLQAIHATAQRENARRNITGLLIFNGTHFLQIIEGEPEPLAQLVENLRRDPRHRGLEVRHDTPIDERSFPDWSMELGPGERGEARSQGHGQETAARRVAGRRPKPRHPHDRADFRDGRALTSRRGDRCRSRHSRSGIE